MTGITFQFSFKSAKLRDVVARVFQNDYLPILIDVPYPLVGRIIRTLDDENLYGISIICYTAEQINAVLETFYPVDQEASEPIGYRKVQMIPETI